MRQLPDTDTAQNPASSPFQRVQPETGQGHVIGFRRAAQPAQDTADLVGLVRPHLAAVVVLEQQS